jgi:hypothetical protein
MYFGLIVPAYGDYPVTICHISALIIMLQEMHILPQQSSKVMVIAVRSPYQ